MPTLTASAPALMSASAAAPVATLPAMTCRSGNLLLTMSMVCSTLAECPWAESSTTTSTLAFTSSWALSRQLAVIPRAAPHRRRPCSSLADSGYLICFSISLMVIRPFRLKSSSTMGNFSFLALARIFLASSRVMPSFAVISPSDVMDSLIFFVKSSSNFRSRLVMIPTSFLPSVMGTPEIRNLPISSLASASVFSGER